MLKGSAQGFECASASVRPEPSSVDEVALLPCPFCGGTNLVVRKDISEDEPKRWYAFHVYCRSCHCHGRNHYPIGWAESVRAASEAWNDRRGPAERELDAISAAIGSVRFMDPPDGGDVSLADQVRRMRVELEAKEARLAALENGPASLADANNKSSRSGGTNG